MADKHEEAARKKALAAKYADIARKREETLKERLSNAQYDFFRNQGHSVDQTIYSDLVTAMRNPSTVPSEYVSKKLGWLFDLAIPSRENDVDEATAIQTAIDAVTDGLVRVFKGHAEITDLDAEIEVAEGDVFTFVRLTMLSGRMW